MLSCGWMGKRNSYNILAAAVWFVVFDFIWKGKEAEIAAFLACSGWGGFWWEQWSSEPVRCAARRDPAFSRELLAKPDFRSDERFYGDPREGCLMFAQPGEVLKAVGLAARNGRDPFTYLRCEQWEGDIHPPSADFFLIWSPTGFKISLFMHILQNYVVEHSNKTLSETVSLFSLKKRHKKISQSPFQALLSWSLSMILNFVSTWTPSFKVVIENKFEWRRRGRRQFLWIRNVNF